MSDAGPAGLDVADPDRVSGRVGQDLDVPAVLVVFAGVPQVVAGVLAFGLGLITA